MRKKKENNLIEILKVLGVASITSLLIGIAKIENRKANQNGLANTFNKETFGELEKLFNTKKINKEQYITLLGKVRENTGAVLKDGLQNFLFKEVQKIKNTD